VAKTSLKTYIGVPCKRGHVERYVAYRKCAVCIRERHTTPQHRATRRARHAANPEKVLEPQRARRAANPELTRQKERNRRGLPEPTRACPNKCECCGTPFGVSVRKSCLDHCHISNTFRGWLCGHCNRALGLLGDDIKGVLNALNYLVRVTA
jgi:hypothetical protein